MLDLRAERLTEAVVENIRIRIEQLFGRYGFREAQVSVRRTLDPAHELEDDLFHRAGEVSSTSRLSRAHRFVWWGSPSQARSISSRIS